MVHYFPANPSPTSQARAKNALAGRDPYRGRIGGGWHPGERRYHQLATAHVRQAQVFIVRNQRYDGDLARTIRDGLIATGLQPAGMAGKRVLLKPNMVEPSKAARHMTTHPAVVVAVAEVCRGWGPKWSWAKRRAMCAIRKWLSWNRALSMRSTPANFPLPT